MKTTLQKGKAYYIVLPGSIDAEKINTIASAVAQALEIKLLGAIASQSAHCVQFIESNGEWPDKLGRRPAVRCVHMEKGKQCARMTRADGDLCNFHGTQIIETKHMNASPEQLQELKKHTDEKSNNLGFDVV